MKCYVLTIVVLLLICISANAAVYNISSGYFESMTLKDHDTLTMTGGGRG